MENHPIPQDVTGFKFRLIGSITVKQFLYLLGGGVIALLFYFFPIPFLIKLPFMLLSAGVSLSLAFIPIDGRPMDKMIYNFIKAIPAENQYIYKKQGVAMQYFFFTPLVHAREQTILSSQDSAAVQKAKLFNELSKSYFKPDQDEQEKVESVSKLFKESSVQPQGFTTRVIKADANPTETATIVGVAQVETKKAQTLSQPHMPSSTFPTQKTVESTQKINEQQPSISEPATAASQTTQLKQAVPDQETTSQQTISQPPPQVDAHGIDMPNILQGLIQDPRGKPLPHIIVEVLDSNNLPLRTFRTDANGFFRAATPLPNGNYTIHMEDTLKKQEFENFALSMSGTVIAPIQIKSIDQREKLRRELFGVAHNTPQ